MKKNNQLLRLKNIILNERADATDEFLNVLNIDLKNFIQQYFYIIDEPKVSIEKDGRVFNVSISFTSTQIKQFSVLPE